MLLSIICLIHSDKMYSQKLSLTHVGACQYMNEMDLMQSMLDTIDPRIRSVKNYTNAIEIDVTMSLQKIEKLVSCNCH